MISRPPRRVLIDYGISNIFAFRHKLEIHGIACEVGSSPEDVENATLLIIPGVGHFSSAMNVLDSVGLVPAIQEKVLVHKTPVVGVCLGLQLLTEFSEEGSRAGLSLIRGNTVQMESEETTSEKFSNVRWGRLEKNAHVSYALRASFSGQYYFCHSYRVECEPELIVAYSYARGLKFPAIIRSGHIVGIQFHPEKSHSHGVVLLAEIIRELEESSER
jgi:imidazole glycerol-phosphate synthase subunit HisH